MAVSGRAQDIALVDAFLARPKILSGAPPEFGPKPRGKEASWEAAWPVANIDGIVEAGSVRVRYAPASAEPFSILLVYREQCVYRLDHVEEDVRHSNPYWGRALEAPAMVCGPHVHTWALNRDHVLRQDSWEIPCRLPLQQQIRRFDQAFPWFADQVNLALRPDERNFDLPHELV